MDYENIKAKCIDDNLLGATKEYCALHMADYVINRVKTMDDQLVELFFFFEISDTRAD